MSNAIFSLGLYFLILFFFTFFIPSSIQADLTQNNTLNQFNSTATEVSSSVWDLGDNIQIFLSFFTLGIYNPLGMPTALAFLLSAINMFITIILIYAIIIAVRGGGGI